MTDEGFYIFPNSDSQELYLSNLEEKTLQQMNYGRNEIYARHGRLFKSAELMEYFSSQSWYHGTIAPEDFQESMLNDIERSNVNFLYEWEYNEFHPDGYELDQPGYDITKVYPANIYDTNSEQFAGDVWMAYRAVLSSGYREYAASDGPRDLSIAEFAVIDIDQDGVPELLLTNENELLVLICGFDGQNVVNIKSDFCWQGGLPSYFPASHILGFGRAATVGHTENVYIRIVGLEYEEKVLTEMRPGDPNDPEYYVDGELVSEEDYISAAEEFWGQEVRGINFYNNSPVNRGDIKELVNE